MIDAPLPGVGPWDDIVRSHALWHFSFWGPDAERLVKGRERIYLDRFWNEFSADPKNFDEASRIEPDALHDLLSVSWGMTTAKSRRLRPPLGFCG